MKRYFVLTVFSYDTYTYAFDSLNLLFYFIKYRCDCEDSFYIENKWLSQDMMKTLDINYITK